jgi:DNA polymerase III delta subunit
MKIDPKQILHEVNQGQIWPVYWVHGPETYRVREVCRLLQKTLVGDRSLAEETLEGAQVSASDVLSAAAMVPFDGGTRVLWVRDAHLIKEPDPLAELLGPRRGMSELPSVCIFLSKDLDGRRKFSKLLLDKAAVVSCDAIPEGGRPAWIKHLARAKGLEPEALPLELLTGYEPWSLDWISCELDKYALCEQAAKGTGAEVLVGGASQGQASGDAFIEAFLVRRNLGLALEAAQELSNQPETALPLLGLLSWNVRMLGLVVARSRSVRLPPMVESRLRRASSIWPLPEIQALQSALAGLDYSLKQTPQEPLALWGVLIHQFCKN